MAETPTHTDQEESTDREIQVNTTSKAFEEGLDLARKLEVEHAEIGRGSPRRL